MCASCGTGFHATGDTCTENVECNQLKFGNGVIAAATDGCVYGKYLSTFDDPSCMLVCANGYGNNESTVTCSVGGAPALEGLMECTPMSCPAIETEDAHYVSGSAGAEGLVTCPEGEHGGTCAVTCAQGYQGGGVLTCVLGDWDGEPMCSPSPCASNPAIANMNGMRTYCKNGASGSTCDFKCMDGFKKVGSTTCVNGEYDISDAACNSVLCDAIAVADGSISFSGGVTNPATRLMARWPLWSATRAAS